MPPLSQCICFSSTPLHRHRLLRDYSHSASSFGYLAINHVIYNFTFSMHLFFSTQGFMYLKSNNNNSMNSEAQKLLSSSSFGKFLHKVTECYLIIYIGLLRVFSASEWPNPGWSLRVLGQFPSPTVT